MRFLALGLSFGFGGAFVGIDRWGDFAAKHEEIGFAGKQLDAVTHLVPMMGIWAAVRGFYLVCLPRGGGLFGGHGFLQT
ncbi:hypothetical protein [Marinomonas sp. TW1]|uniref:hypothetical protein n=1 Tax=Marinomonas sp. TW1 TaxID=1561203 RepID=UPI0012E713EA|nr:hypothetical protein [Marinomonas sp. TW1]